MSLVFCGRFGAILLVAAVCILRLLAGVVAAGGGPENVFVVVNPRSWASKTVANHFCQMRRIPACNVFFLDRKGSNVWTDVDGLRSEILDPIFTEIDKRGLGGQIDYIVYSADYPFEIRYQSDLPQPSSSASGSISGLTYLSQLVQAKDPRYTQGVNWYMRLPQPEPQGYRLIPEKTDVPTRGFRASYQWGPDGQPVDSGGMQYILSTMLAYTSGRGNSVREAVDYLQRSALADGTFPRGTVYFMKTRDPRAPQNYDVRSTTRERAFSSAVDALKSLGVNALVVDNQILPQNRHDVLGVMAGTREFDWESSGSRMLPGAICENLTSYGGAVHGEERQLHQSRLSQFLRFGAAGSSGTVVEPFALWPKFPHPMIFAHYARGCTLAEAFYQSVLQPYQLLVVGDPLCRPWAAIPIVRLEGLEPGDSISGKVAITPSAEMPPGSSLSRFELYVDGQRVAECEPGSQFDLDTEKLPDGYHEIRIVAVDASLIESQGRLILPITVNNRDGKLVWATKPNRIVPWEKPLAIGAKSPGAKSIIFVQGRRLIGQITGEFGQIQVEPSQFGYGPVTLQAVALHATDPQQHVVGPPIQLRIEPPRPLPASRLRTRRSGIEPMQVRLASGQRVPTGNATGWDWLAQAGVELNQPFQISGYVNAPEEDVYQFELEFVGQCVIRVNDLQLFRQDSDINQHYYVPVALERGIHRVNISGTLRTTPKFLLAFGNGGTSPISSPQFQPAP